MYRHPQNITPHNVILEISDFGDPEKFRVHTSLSRDSQASLENDVFCFGTAILEIFPPQRHTQNITPHNVILEISDFGDPEKFRVRASLMSNLQTKHKKSLC